MCDSAIIEGVRNATRAFQTGLRKGVYCDVIHGRFSHGTCTGPTVSVDRNGVAMIIVAAKDGVAIYGGSLIGR
jgi:alpha-amylase